MHRAVTGTEPKYIRRVEEYLEAHCDQPITSEAVAAVAGMSTVPCTKVLNAIVGIRHWNILEDVRRRVRDELLAANQGLLEDDCDEMGIQPSRAVQQSLLAQIRRDTIADVEAIVLDLSDPLIASERISKFELHPPAWR